MFFCMVLGPYIVLTVMDRHVYADILNTTILIYAEYEMPLKWVFQQDNDPKYTSPLAKKWFRFIKD